MITREIILDSFQAVRDNTIEIARDIPESQFGFRPAAETKTVLEYFQQILTTTEFMTGIALHPEEIALTPQARPDWMRRLTWSRADSLATKDAIIAALRDSMAEIQRRVRAADLAFLNSTFRAPDGRTKVRLWVVQCAKEQEMALRAQLFLIERMLGIVPHTTRRQQQQAQQQ